MSHAHAEVRTDLNCRNCGAYAPQAYCPACGQETALHPPTLGEFLHEFIGHYVALEGALWRTLHLLLLRPGRLTLEYLAGRRRAYVLPLRVYLTASFVFFLVFKLTPTDLERGPSVQIERAGAAASTPAAIPASSPAALSASSPAPSPTASRPVIDMVDCGDAGEPVCDAMESFLKRVGQRFEEDPRGTMVKLRSSMLSTAPYAVFLLLPVFAGFLSLVYRRRHCTYGEHFVFSLHLHAFWFTALTAAVLVPASIEDVVLLTVPLYGVLAMRRVYRGGWGPTLARAIAVSALYGGALVLTTGALVLVFLSAR